jgi:hypothetical protein
MGYDMNHGLVAAKFRKRMGVNKRRTQKLDMEGFNPKELNEVEGKEQYQVIISNRFPAVDINRTWETIREHIVTV